MCQLCIRLLFLLLLDLWSLPFSKLDWSSWCNYFKIFPFLEASPSSRAFFFWYQFEIFSSLTLYNCSFVHFIMDAAFLSPWKKFDFIVTIKRKNLINTFYSIILIHVDRNTFRIQNLESINYWKIAYIKSLLDFNNKLLQKGIAIQLWKFSIVTSRWERWFALLTWISATIFQ